MDLIFLCIFLFLASLFLGMGLWRGEWLFGFIGAVLLLLLGLLIMGYGVEVYAGYTANTNVSLVSNTTGGLGACWNETSYLYNQTNDLTGLINTTVCTCENDFQQNSTEASDSTASYVRLNRDIEMAVALILSLAAIYFMYQAVYQAFFKRREDD